MKAVRSVFRASCLYGARAGVRGPGAVGCGDRNYGWQGFGAAPGHLWVGGDGFWGEELVV